MSTTRVERVPLTRAQALIFICKALLSPAFLVCVAFIGFSRFIYSGFIVGFLKTFLAVPSGAVAIVAIVLFGACGVGGLTMLIREAVLVGRLRKAGTVRHPNLWYLAAFFLSLHMLIPPVVALEWWSGMQKTDGRLIDGKLTLRSPKQQLQHSIGNLEREGTWTWLLKGQK